MRSEPDAMDAAAQLLNDLVGGDRLTSKALALEAGLDYTTIRRYLTGERTVPVAVVRAAFALTGDWRLVRLVTGRQPIGLHLVTTIAPADAVAPAAPPLRIPPIAQLLPSTTRALRSAADATDAVAAVVADGRVTPSDGGAIERFAAAAAEVERLLALVRAALDAAHGAHS